MAVLRFLRCRWSPLTLAALLAVALGLRLYGLNWDWGLGRHGLFHPDERAIMMKVAGDISLPWPPDWGKLLDASESPLNPRWFPYGSFPLYLLKLSAHAVGFVWNHRFSGPDLALVGRGISAVLDTATVLLVFLLGRRLYGRNVGLLAAAFATFAVLHIQLSHFYTVDAPLAFLAVLTLFFSARAMERPTPRNAIPAGVFLGLALATKVSVAPIFLAVGVAYGLHAFPGRSLRLASFSPLHSWYALRGLVLTLVFAGLAFVLAEPFALIDHDKFFADTREQSEMVRRILDYPYTRQYVDTTPYLYHIQQLGTWGLGPPLGILVWAALAFTIVAALTRREKGDLLLLAWVVPYFLIVGSFPVKFLRYLLPITPFLFIMGARLMRDWLAWAWRRRERLTAFATRPALASAARLLAHPAWPVAAIVLVLAGSVSYAFAYDNIYSRPHPAVRAGRWIDAHAPPGATIAQEHWEEGIPTQGDFHLVTLDLYDPDNEAKLEHIVQRLQEADYIVFYSNRLYGTIPRLRERYPLTTRYYEKLFSGGLGFDLAYYATSYPQLPGIAFVDDTFERPGLPEPQALRDETPATVTVRLPFADESFTVYDHPKVMVFAKNHPLDEAALRDLLSPGLAQSPPKTGLLMSESETRANRAGGTWSALFDRGSLANRVPLLAWLLLVEVVALAALPLTAVLFRSLPDRGYLLAKTLGLLLVAYLTWLFASVHVFTFSRATVALSLLLVAAASAAATWRFRAELREFVAARWRLLLAGEALFLLAFLSFYALRLWNPDLWQAWRGGEKPMDFAYLNAVLKSTRLPPYDPWFSGGYLNYYYFGQFIVACPIKLLGIVPSVAYNLAVPLLFALTVSGVFSVVFNLTEATRRARGGADVRWPRGPMLAALFAVLAVTVFGNLDGLYQLVQGLWNAGGSKLASAVPVIGGLWNALVGAWHVAFGSTHLPAFDFWRPSRMMPLTTSITEFPYFSFLFADLHAHVIGLPFTVLAIGAALAFVLQARPFAPQREEHHSLVARLRPHLTWADAGLLVFAAVVVGALRWINSWDLPTYLLLFGAAVLIAEYVRFRRFTPWLLVSGAAKVGVVYGLLTLLYLPFAQRYQLFYGGVNGYSERTPLHQYLGIHALFLFVLVTFLVVELVLAARRNGVFRLVSMLVARWQRLPRAARLLRLVYPTGVAWALWAYYALAVLAAFVGLLAAGLTTVAFLAVLLAVTLALALREVAECQPGVGAKLFVYALFALAVCIGIGVEFLRIDGDIDRMNTVFKFYLQAWVLYGIAAAYALWHLFSRRDDLRAIVPPRRRSSAPPLLRRPLVLGWLAVLVVLVLAVLLYPIEATPARERDRFTFLSPRADGMSYMQHAVYPDENGAIDLKYDYEAIRWLQDNVEGSPVILEGCTPLYRWGSRVSVYTGLPTVIGWDWHEKQQRWEYRWMVDERQADVATMYSTTDPDLALELMEKYDVRYVYVGRLENLYYPSGGVDKFDGMVGRGLELVHENEQVKIYRVTASERVAGD